MNKHVIDNYLNIHGTACYVCHKYVKKINQFTIIILLCSTILLTIAIDRALLVICRSTCLHECGNARKKMDIAATCYVYSTLLH